MVKTENRGGGSVFWKPLGAILAGSWGRLGVFLASKREPRASTKRSKNRSKFCCMLGSIFEKILIGFGMQIRAKLASKSIKNRSWGESKIGLGMSLRGLWRGLGGQNRKPRRGIRFLEVSWGHLGGLLGPSWGLLGFQKKAKSVQKAIQKSIKI